MAPSVLVIATISRRNWVSMWTSFWVAQEAADALVEFGTNNMLEFACLGARLTVVDSEGVRKQAFRQPMTTYHVARPAFSAFRQYDLAAVLHLQ